MARGAIEGGGSQAKGEFLKIAGYNSQETKREMLKFLPEDPINLIKKEKLLKRNQIKESGHF